MQFRIGFATDVGRRRAQNQDSFTVAPEIGLFVVADGMGGHKGGETASSMAVDIIPHLVREAQKSPSWDPRHVIADSIQRASRAIYDRSAQNPELQGMGTTTTALLFKDGKLAIGHVGDSRCYFMRPAAIWQATRDHSLVQEKLRAGLITREEVKTDKMKNVITRSVGFEPVVNVETYDMEARPGDVFLICSDGLSGLVEDYEIIDIVQRNVFDKNSPELAVQQLIEGANNAGGDDNITAILIQVLN